MVIFAIIYLLVFQFLVKHTVFCNIFKILNQKIYEQKFRNVANLFIPCPRQNSSLVDNACPEIKFLRKSVGKTYLHAQNYNSKNKY